MLQRLFEEMQYVVVTGLDTNATSAATRTAILLTWMGIEVYDIIKMLNISDKDRKSDSKVI